jgi:riboflavin synthase
VRSLFTGLVEEMGIVKDVQILEDGGFEMTIEASTVLEDVKPGAV